MQCTNAAGEGIYLPLSYGRIWTAGLRNNECCTPVSVSNCTFLSEVAGDAGVYINPYNVDLIVSRGAGIE